MHIDTIDEVPERYRVLLKYYLEKKPNENTSQGDNKQSQNTNKKYTYNTEVSKEKVFEVCWADDYRWNK